MKRAYNPKAVGEPCPYCRRPLSQEIVDFKRLSKADNARASREKALARGTPMGRPKIRDDELIRQLRKAGHSIRTIAAMIKLSPAGVQRGLKTMTSPKLPHERSK